MLLITFDRPGDGLLTFFNQRIPETGPHEILKKTQILQFIYSVGRQMADQGGPYTPSLQLTGEEEGSELVHHFLHVQSSRG